MKIAVLVIIMMMLVLMARIMMMSFRLKASSFFIQLLVQVEGQLHENERVADKLKQDLRQKRSTLLERRPSFAIRSDGVSFIGLPSMSFQRKLIGVHKQIIFAQGCVGYRPDGIHS